MRVDLAVLSDYATMTADQKLVIVGVFDTILVHALPAAHPSLHLALRVCIGPEDTGAHSLLVRLVDPDGREVIPALKADFDADIPMDGDQGALQMVLEIGPVPFAAEGPHAVDILIDDRYEDAVPLRIKLTSHPELRGQVPRHRTLRDYVVADAVATIDELLRLEGGAHRDEGS